jgi:hypothetical protein
VASVVGDLRQAVSVVCVKAILPTGTPGGVFIAVIYSIPVTHTPYDANMRF